MKDPLYDFYQYAMQVVDEVCARSDLLDATQEHEAFAILRKRYPPELKDITINVALNFFFEKKRMR